MKHFNLDEYLANPERKIITRDGRKVRIVCTDRAGLYTKPIVALITLPNGDEVMKAYWKDGIETKGYEDNKNDIFFAPTKRWGWVNLYLTGGIHSSYNIYATQEEALKERGNVDYVTTTKIEWEE